MAWSVNDLTVCVFFFKSQTPLLLKIHFEIKKKLEWYSWLLPVLMCMIFWRQTPELTTIWYATARNMNWVECIDAWAIIWQFYNSCRFWREDQQNKKQNNRRNTLKHTNVRFYLTSCEWDKTWWPRIYWRSFYFDGCYVYLASFNFDVFIDSGSDVILCIGGLIEWMLQLIETIIAEICH